MTESMKNGIYRPASSYSDDGIACLRMYNIDQGKIVWRDIKRMTLMEEEIEEYELLPGDLLVNRVNSRELVGKTVAIPPNFERCVFESKNIRVRLRPDVVVPEYVCYRLLAEGSRYFMQNAQQVVGMASINQSQVASFPLPLAPINEQRRIVAEIEKQFTRLDAGVAALLQIQTNLKRYRAAVLKAACEGRLVPTEAQLARTEGRSFESGYQLLSRTLNDRRQWFSDHQKKTKTKKRYVEPVKPEITSLSPLPDGWAWGTWNQLSNWVTYGFTRPMPHVDDGVPIVTAKSVNKGQIDFKRGHHTTMDAYAKLSEKDRPQLGDILITKDGTIGRAAIVDADHDFCINQSVAVIWLRSCSMSRKFLLSYIESELTQKPLMMKARGVAIQHLSITDFAKMALPIPPHAEQTRIVAEIERRSSVVDGLEMMISTSLLRAKQLRQVVLRKAFSCELTQQDVNDEPMKALLHRMQLKAQQERKPARVKTMAKRTKISQLKRTRTVLEVLAENRSGISPETLFAECGRDSTKIEEVEDFFAEIRELHVAQQILEVRKDASTVFLKGNS